jgi:hypothetical protein
MTNTSANHYHRSRLIGKILQMFALFSQMRRLTEGTRFPVPKTITSVFPSSANKEKPWILGEALVSLWIHMSKILDRLGFQ